MGPTPSSDARAPERGPMAHRARRSVPRPAAAATAPHRGASPVAAALTAEAAELAAMTRRVVPNRRIAVLVGLALLAVLALGGMAGAAEPRPANRSALDAFAAPSASALAVSSPAGAVGAAGSVPLASAGAALPAVTAAPLGASAGALADDPAFQGPNLFDLVTKTALVVALLFVTLRVLRRVQGAGPARGSGLLAVLESRTLGPKTQLHLVAVGDRRLVIGQSPAGLVALGELDAAELPVAEPVREPWDRRDTQHEDPELEAQAAHELANGRRPRLGVSA